MNNREQQKRALRLQHSERAQKDAPGRRWADRQISDVRLGRHWVNDATDIASGRIDTAEINTNAITSTELRNDSVTNTKLAAGSVSVGKMQNDSVGTVQLINGTVSISKMQNNSVGTAQVLDETVTPAKLDRAYVQPGSTGSTTVNSLGVSHSHSISSTTFIKQPRETRYRMLDDRSDLEALLTSEALCAADQVVAKNVHNLLVLLMDYKEMNAYQRERAFLDPALADWADNYKRVYGVDEYAEADRENFLSYTLGNGEEHTHVRMDPYTGIAPVSDNEG